LQFFHRSHLRSVRRPVDLLKENQTVLAGEAVAAIWNGIAPEGRDQFYDWHINEHIPERVGIPGFRRGRRYIAVDADTQPEFFTLYETDSMQVLQGTDYTNRLNDPTPWTKGTTAWFRDTARALARVLVSHGPGAGGVILTIRFDCDDQHIAAIRALICDAVQAARVTGAHLCQSDTAASALRTAESRDRTDIQAPPNCFTMIEATDTEALTNILPDIALSNAGLRGPFVRGIYRLEYTRTKTKFAP
jgi:hypothetical protein